MSADTPDPFAFARADDTLIEAGRRLDDLLSRWDQIADEDVPALCDAQYREIEIINNTPPTSLAGAAVKLRVLAHRDHGIGRRSGRRLHLAPTARRLYRTGGAVMNGRPS